jgi:hypothetical protein
MAVRILITARIITSKLSSHTKVKRAKKFDRRSVGGGNANVRWKLQSDQEEEENVVDNSLRYRIYNLSARSRLIVDINLSE